MEYVEEIIKSVKFEKVSPNPDETLELCRIPTEKGCVEFVKLYANTYYPPHVHEKANSHLIIISGNGPVLIEGKKQKSFSSGKGLRRSKKLLEIRK